MGDRLVFVPVEVQEKYVVATGEVQAHPSSSEGNCEHLRSNWGSHEG